MADEFLNCGKSAVRTSFNNQIKPLPVSSGQKPGQRYLVELYPRQPTPADFQPLRGGVYLSANNATTSTCRPQTNAPKDTRTRFTPYYNRYEHPGQAGEEKFTVWRPKTGQDDNSVTPRDFGERDTVGNIQAGPVNSPDFTGRKRCRQFTAFGCPDDCCNCGNTVAD